MQYNKKIIHLQQNLIFFILVFKASKAHQAYRENVGLYGLDFYFLAMKAMRP